MLTLPIKNKLNLNKKGEKDKDKKVELLKCASKQSSGFWIFFNTFSSSNVAELIPSFTLSFN